MPITKSASSIKAGTVAYFAASSAPAGWIKANGAAVSRSAYGALFTAIGTTYGAGDGSTTFNVPDLRGEFVRGLDDGRGVDSGRGVGTAQGDSFRTHSHKMYATGTGSGVYPSHVYNDYSQSSTEPNTLNSGSSGSSETRPRNVAMLACIKY